MPQVTPNRPGEKIVTRYLSEWRAVITPNLEGFDIVLAVQQADSPQPGFRLRTTILWNVPDGTPATPWKADTLHRARKLARHKLREQRRQDRKLDRQASLVDAGPITIGGN